MTLSIFQVLANSLNFPFKYCVKNLNYFFGSALIRKNGSTTICVGKDLILR